MWGFETNLTVSLSCLRHGDQTETKAFTKRSNKHEARDWHHQKWTKSYISSARWRAL